MTLNYEKAGNFMNNTPNKLMFAGRFTNKVKEGKLLENQVYTRLKSGAFEKEFTGDYTIVPKEEALNDLKSGNGLIFKDGKTGFVRVGIRRSFSKEFDYDIFG